MFVQESDVQMLWFEVAETLNLFDGDMYPEYCNERLLETLPFLNPVMKTMTSYSGTHNPDMIEVLCDLFKYYKQKLITQTIILFRGIML
jgi:hypothetical protein